MRPFRVGIIGLGAMGGNHLRTIQKLQGAIVSGVYDPEPAGWSATELGPILTTHLSEFLTMGHDYVVVASPTSTHGTMSAAVASIKVPCIIEKPLAATVSEATEIVEQFESKGLQAALGFVERFNPAVLKAKELVSSGAIGDILQISLIRQGPFSARSSDVGVGIDLGSHDVDLATWLCGSRFRHFSSYGSIVRSERHEDVWQAQGVTESNSLVDIQVSRVSPRKIRTMAILGSEGSLEIDNLNFKVAFSSNISKPVLWEEQKRVTGAQTFETVSFSLELIEPLVGEHLEFQKFLSTGDPGALSSLQNGLDVLTLIEGAK